MNEPEVVLLERETNSEEYFHNAEEYFPLRIFRFSVTSDYHFDKLSASVRMPSGKKDVVHIKVNFIRQDLLKFFSLTIFGMLFFVRIVG